MATHSPRALVAATHVALLAVLVLACGPSATAPPGRGEGAPRAATAVAAAPPQAAPATAAPPPLERIRISFSATSLSFLSTFVAQDRGFFARNGLEAELVQATAQVGLAGMMNGDVDFSMAFGSQARAAARGLPVRMLEESGKVPLLFLIARPEIRSIPELRDRVISVVSIGGTNNQTATLLLRKHGVDPQTAQYIAGGDSPRQMEMLRHGQVDAALIAPPYPYLARREGFNLLANAQEEIDLPFTGLSTSLDTLSRRPELVRRTIRAELETLQHLHGDRADTIRLIEERFSMEPELAAQAYDLAIASYTRDGSISRPGVENFLALEKEEGAIPEHVRFEDIVDLRPLEEVQRAMGLVP